MASAAFPCDARTSPSKRQALAFLASAAVIAVRRSSASGRFPASRRASARSTVACRASGKRSRAFCAKRFASAE